MNFQTLSGAHSGSEMRTEVGKLSDDGAMGVWVGHVAHVCVGGYICMLTH